MAISQVLRSPGNIEFRFGKINSGSLTYGSSTTPVEVGDIIFFTGMQKGGNATDDSLAVNMTSSSGTALEQFDLTGSDWPARLGTSNRYYWAYYHKVVSADVTNGVVRVFFTANDTGKNEHLSMTVWRGVDLTNFDSSLLNQVINCVTGSSLEDSVGDNTTLLFADYDTLGINGIATNSSNFPGACTALGFATCDIGGSWDPNVWTGGQDFIPGTGQEYTGSGCSTVMGYRDFASLSAAVAGSANGLGTPWQHAGTTGSTNCRDHTWWILLPEAVTSTPGTPATLTADYAIKVTGTPKTLDSQYTVKLTGDPETLTSSYAVKSDGTDVDLSSEYTVKLTGDPETLTSSYAVKSTGTAQTLDSEYTVKLTGDPKALSSSYAVKDQGQAQTLDSEYAVKDTTGTASLSGSYVVQSTGTPASLSSEYEVAVAGSENLSSDYAIKVQGDAQSLSSSYAVKKQGQEQALDSDYSIKDTTGTANLTGSYAVKSTGTLASLSSEYEVSVSQADNLGSSYAVKVQGDSVSLASSYDISSATAGVAVDLDSQYSVKTTGSPQSIDGEYAVKDQGNAQVLSAGYAVKVLINNVNIGAEYTVAVTGDPQQVSSTYAVKSSSDQALTGSYVISESDAIELASLYSVKISDTSEVSSSYTIGISDTADLSASYTLIESKTQEIVGSYEITGFTASAPIAELYAEYAVINQNHLGYKAFRQLSILRQRVK